MSSTEIGSEFWNIPVRDEKNDLFPHPCYWYVSGRAALLSIIRSIKKRFPVHSVAMPNWFCDSMAEPFLREAIHVETYPWDTEVIDTEADILFVMDYFGFRKNIRFSGYSGIVIRDLTHTIFCGKYEDADYYFGSLRKWAGFLTGGFAWGEGLCQPVGQDDNYTELRRLAMKEKERFINGESEDKTYLNLFHKAELMLGTFTVSGGAAEDVFAAVHLNDTFIFEKRRENAQFLIKSFPENVIFRAMNDSDCPLFVPVLFDDRNGLRKWLSEHRIYCPTHWFGNEMNGKELSLVCDQRYNLEDMDRMVHTIKEYYAKSN